MNTRANRKVQGDSHNVGGRHAVVLGGSLAGLLAARILADHFEKVTILERDAYLETTEVRKGIPQANHVHGLLLRGRQFLEDLFPGLQDEMIAAGAPLVDMANDIPWYTRAGWGVRFPSEMKVLAFTRPMLDLHVRRRLVENPKVEICDQMDVLGLVRDSKDNRIAGVLVSPRNTESDRRVAKQVDADLVIDATGRASRAPRWLQDLGYEAPKETMITAHLGYASRLFKIPENFEGDWSCAYVQSAPPKRKRGGILFRVEDDRWLVTLIGGGRDYPPGDEQGFLEFAESLPVPIIADAIRAAEPVTPIRTHRATENRLRHFDKVRNLPENFLVLGDAACAFNPVYGQGMTTAALGVLKLQRCLEEQKRLHADGSLCGLARRFQKQLAQVNKAPWLMATGEDYRYREAVGGSPGVMTRFMHWYMDRVLKLATREVEVRSVLLRVFSMVLPPKALFGRAVLLRVIKEGIFSARVRDAAPQSGRKIKYKIEPRYGMERR